MQINNIKIQKLFKNTPFEIWSCHSPDGRELETFKKLTDAQQFAHNTRDFRKRE